MSKSFKKSFFFTGDILQKDVKILQSGYGSFGSWNYPLRSSSFWYLWRNRTEGARVICSGQSHSLDPDHYILVPPFTPFSTESRVLPMIQLYMHFTTGMFFRSVKRRVIRINADLIDPIGPEAFFSRLEQCAGQHNQLQIHLLRLLYCLLDHLMQDKEYQSEKGNMHKLTLSFLNSISSSLQKKHLYDEFCHEHSVSQPTMLRLFKKDTGMTPEQYLISCRLAEVKNLLLHSAYSLDEIAELTGFSDRYHLSKIFRKYEHIPPAAYRKSSFRLTEETKE